MKRLLLSSFIFIFIFITTLLVGCKDKNKKNPIHIDTKEVVEDTVHDYEKEETSYSFISNGETEYVCVLPEGTSDFDLAVNELKTFFEEATGISLKTIYDTGLSLDSEKKYISIGNTKLVQDANIEVDYEELGDQGFIIKTIEKSIFICGKKLGVLYGVYRLLFELFEYETYTNKVTYINKNVKNLNLSKFSIKEVPDILYRVASDGPAYMDSITRRRMKLMHTSEIIPQEGDVHNVLNTIVPLNEESVQLHPDWFSNDREQLCYTAHGKEDEYESMVCEAVNNIKEIVLKETNKNVISITQMDINVWCGCESCLKLKEKYGTDAASQIIFVNDVSSRIEKWLNETQNGRKIQFVIFAYHKTETAPAKKDENGNWKPIDEKVILNDNVSIWVAPISSNYYVSVHDDLNISMKQAMEAWRVCAKSYFFWGYNSYYGTYLIPFDSYNGMQDLVKYCVELNSILMFPQGKYNTAQNTGFDDLKDYLYAKLMWNCNEDINALISDFFKKVYREASEDMEEAFWAWRVQSIMQDEAGRDGSVWTNLKSTKYWTKQFFMNMLEKMESAKTKIEKYKDVDTDVYNSIYDSIVCETIFPRYMLCEVYSSTFSNIELNKMKSEFKADILRLHFTRISENSLMDTFISTY